MINIGISGAMGRMGHTIFQETLSQSDQFLVKKVFEHKDHSMIRQKYIDTDLILEDMNQIQKDEVECIIDFTIPESTLTLIEQAVQKSIPLVIGTTGFDSKQMEVIEKASENIPILISSNMSIGVNMLFALVSKASKALSDKNYDPEIMEIHHRHKKDAPSGTARTLEKIISDAYKLSQDNVINGREGMIGERPQRQLGSMALRGGDVVGEHSVYFLGEGERLELKHSATSRVIFAQGALLAGSFIVGEKYGLFSMADVLNL